MGVRFSADDLLAMAERIEANGAAFYRAAAEVVASSATSSLLAGLAEWEVGHGGTFAAMRAALTEEEKAPTAYDPDDEAALYLQAVADGAVFKGSQDPTDRMGQSDDLGQILGVALAKEHESIAFYAAMRGYVPERLGRHDLDAVIREEYGHVRQLAEQIGKLRSRPA